MKDTNKLIKNVLRALPSISIPALFAPKKTSSILPFVLGAVGVAFAGGIAAVMIFRPRTRYRALDIAKDGYGKVKGQSAHSASSTVNRSAGVMASPVGSDHSQGPT